MKEGRGFDPRIVQNKRGRCDSAPQIEGDAAMKFLLWFFEPIEFDTVDEMHATLAW